MANAGTNTSTGHNGHWLININSAGLYELSTEGKYVDRNIDINAPSNTIVGSVDSLTAPSVSVSGTATGMETSTTATDYYVTVNGTGTNGSVKGKATAGTTTGIVAASATNTSASTAITPTITGSGNKVYIKGAGVTKGTTTKGATKGSDGNYSLTRGTYDISAGYINGTSGDLAAATFSNSATAGTTYVDISETAGSPILVSGSGLYINQGYVDNLYISLAKLSPNGASGAAAIKAGMLNTVSAYDNDGNLVTGNIATKSSTDLTVSGATVTVPAGYYSSQATKSIANAGAATVVPSANTGTVTVGVVSDGYYPLTNTISASSTHASAGYVGTTAETGSKSIQVGKILQSAITNNTSGGTSSETINAGKQIKIGKGYYPDDRYYTAQSFTTWDGSYTTPTN